MLPPSTSCAVGATLFTNSANPTSLQTERPQKPPFQITASAASQHRVAELWLLPGFAWRLEAATVAPCAAGCSVAPARRRFPEPFARLGTAQTARAAGRGAPCSHLRIPFSSQLGLLRRGAQLNARLGALLEVVARRKEAAKASLGERRLPFLRSDVPGICTPAVIPSRKFEHAAKSLV